MSKKRKHRKPSQSLAPRVAQPSILTSPTRPLTPEAWAQEGLRAFKNGRYTEALDIWEKLDWPDKQPALTAAIAEAHFRLAVGNGIGEGSAPHLERAVSLLPTDPIYAYYLGLALHRQGRLAEAMEAYRRAVANGLARPGAGLVIALAALELDPKTDLATVPGVSPQDRQTLDLALALLQGKPREERPPSLWSNLADRLKLTPPSPTRLVLDGLALLAQDKPEARQFLVGLEAKSWPRIINAVRWYYAGVAAARQGDLASALDAWKQAYHLDSRLVGLHNLSVAYARQSMAHMERGDWAQAAQLAMDAHKLASDDSALGALALDTLNRAAHEAVKQGDWNAAARYWADARQVLSTLPGGGTPRPILHNLALAYEASQRWEPAAEAWRAMLRTKPRKKSLDGFSQEHWTWVRQRVIECYKQAGRSDEAITIFRQAIKADPDNAEMQLDLVHALLANGQEQAAYSELHRLLKKHPQHIEALLLLAELETQRGEWHAAEMTMRQAIAAEPENDQVRRRMADILRARAGNLLNSRNSAAARDLYEQALKYAPDDYNLALGLARAEFNLRHVDQARQHLERALELGQDKSDAYEQAFICWIIERNFDEARAVQQRGEATGKLTPDFYIHTGLECLFRAAPAPEMPNLDFLFGLGRRTVRSTRSRSAPRSRELETLGKQLLDQAIALGPEADVLRHIVSEVGPEGANIGLPYARRLVEITPEDAVAWMLLGVYLGAERQIKEGQDALRQAARLARKQGNHELARNADGLRRAIADPLFGISLQLALSGFGYDFD